MAFTSPKGNPDILQSDFSLGRKMAFAGDAWTVTANLTLTAQQGSVLVAPGMGGSGKNLMITGFWLDASVAARFLWGYAASVASPTTITPVNLNSLAEASAVPTFTSQSSLGGAVTGFVQMASTDLQAATGFPYVDLTNAPIFLPPLGGLGFMILSNSITGVMHVSITLHEYNY